MTKSQMLKAFWSKFGLKAYEEHSVPPGTQYPYITYSASCGDFGGSVPLSASVWYRDTGWSKASAKAEEIGSYIGMGGQLVKYDGGAAWIQRASPFSTYIGDPADDAVRRVIMNITVQYISQN